MRSTDAVNVPSLGDFQGEQDLGPLAWVLDELRKSLDGAVKALRRFVYEAELARGSDLAALDVGPLRLARQQLHQAGGALEMVGMGSPALVLRAMESAMQKFVQRPELCTDEAAGMLERASFALGEYLENVLAGKAVSAVALFPQYRDVQILNGVSKVHPADLWAVERRFREPELEGHVPAQAYGPAARARLDQAVLKIVQSADTGAARELCNASLGFAAAQNDPRVRAFWKISAGFFEAFSLGLFQPDVYVKRAASRILMQYATLSKGDVTITDRLVQDLLFFCAQARECAPDKAPALDAVRKVFELERFPAVNYEVRRFGRFDPAVLVQARKRIAAAAETWSALAGGDRQKLKPVADQFSLVCDSLRKLQRSSEGLAQALTRAVDMTVQSGEPPAAGLAMEVATSVLYLQAALEELDAPPEQLAQRAQRLAERLDHVCAGAEPEPLEAWMEELYRRVSDRQTMGSVVGELRATLGEAERAMDQFFRDPHNMAPLATVPTCLAQMRGVLSVLGLDQASLAVARMRDTVEHLLGGHISDESARHAAFEKLGNSLGALGFMIDMLSYQRALARKLFVYDEELGELRSLMGRDRVRTGDALQERPQLREEKDAPPASASASATAPALELPGVSAPVNVPDSEEVEEIEETEATANVAQTFDEALAQELLGQDLLPVPDFAVQEKAAEPLDAPEVAAAPGLDRTAFAAVPSAPVLQPVLDDELLDIFLEEVREVVLHGKAAAQVLGAEPDNLSEQTTLRRSFHTLKGSSRMVGLHEFGEAAWSIEQVFNLWLAEQKPMDAPLLQLARQTLEGFGCWAADIEAGDASAWKASAFVRAAQALSDGLELPSVLPAMADAGLALKSQGGDASFGDFPAGGMALFEPQELADLSLSLTAAFQNSEQTLPTAASALEPAVSATESEEIDASILPPLADAEEIDFSEFSEALSAAAAGAPEAQHSDSDSGGETAIQNISVETAESAEIAESLDGTIDPPDLDADEFFAAFERAGAADAADAAPVATSELQLPPLEGRDQEEAAAAASEEPSFEEAENASAAKATAAEPGPFAETGQEPEEVAQENAHFSAVDADLVHDFGLLLSPQEQEGPAFVASELPAAHETSFEMVQHTDAEPDHGLPEMEPIDGSPQFGPPQQPTEETDGAGEIYAADEVDGADDEAVKVIGSLRIGIPLYNVYLNEADEWSRRLVTELQEWSLELHRPVPGAAIALAHSMAGSSATVGFMALSDTARLLEHALAHVQPQPQGLPAQAQVFVAASEDMRRLLHQFAAGFLKDASAAVQEELRQIIATEPVAAPQQFGGEDPSELADAAAQHEGADTAPEELLAGQDMDQKIDDAIARAVASVSDMDDDIDALDVIDTDLFQFFEDEALELLPSLGSALRQWAARPGNLGARNEVLRALHTLKGSSRLAGALRLGEMAHRMESAIEQINPETVRSQDVEPLLASFDGLQANFDALRTIAAQPQAHAQNLHPDQAQIQAPEPVPVQAARLAGVEEAALRKQAATVQPVSAGLLPAARPAPLRTSAGQSVRVRAQLLDRLINQAGEVMITRSRLETRLGQLKGSMGDLSGNLDRLRQQLRDIEVQSESQMQSRLALSRDSGAGFDPLEFDRFTRVQELTRMMAESVNDVATVQRNLQRAIDGTEDELLAQGRQARELQRDLLRTRMVEFEGISERLYAVVRQSSKETGKQIRLDITGGSIEMDRGVLDRMTPAFEHLLRNCVAHGIEAPELRQAAGKPAVGTITVALQQEGNDVSVEFRDDGAGLDVERIRAKALSQGLIAPDAEVDEAQAAQLIFAPGFTTAGVVTEISGRGIGMDVVSSEVNALGGRIETTTRSGEGSAFRLVLPLTTAVTQVVMLRMGNLSIGVPASLIEVVRRVPTADVQQAYRSGSFDVDGLAVPFYWAGQLMQASQRSSEPAPGKTLPVVVLRSAAQRIAMHVDEVLGNQEVVVKNLGPQLARMPGLAGMSVLASGAVVLIYNPVALSTVYGEQLRSAERALQAGAAAAGLGSDGAVSMLLPLPAQGQVPLVLVVDDSITVRRVTQRLLQREGYRVALAADGLQALERLQDERPVVVLSDIEMPRMDGFDLARNIRADAALADLPIIMITSRIAQKHRDLAMELGVNHYLGKPYSDEELLGLVQQYSRLAALTDLV